MHLCCKHPVELFKDYLNTQKIDWKEGGVSQEPGGFVLKNWVLYLSDGSCLDEDSLNQCGIKYFSDGVVLFLKSRPY
jgi:hypothetical protein